MTDDSPQVRGILIPACIAALLASFLVGCESAVSTLAPAGQAAADIAWITWVMLGGGALLTILMSALWLHASYHGRVQPLRWSEQRILISGGVLLPLVVIVLLLIYGVRSGQSMLPVGTPDLTVRAIGHQWWWQFEYVGPDGQIVRVANELHLPVNARVDVLVASVDVIHSFWVPALAGKLDAIPGRSHTLRLIPTRTGRLVGQCAEFCGAGHAHMRFEVIVHEAEAFADWLHAAALASSDSGNGVIAP
ncbi:MAG: cytochrome c oxidase subunit II [Aquimonas sp.]|nr:cytochrome c oxidase subunit II [Aquimonas sp.]